MILVWILKNKYLTPKQRDEINNVLVHIDDFLIAAESKKDAKDMADKFDQMCRDLGVNVSHEKDKTCIYKGIVHGFGFNLKSKMVWIPQPKFDELLNGLTLVCEYRYATGQVLESLCGKVYNFYLTLHKHSSNPFLI